MSICHRQLAYLFGKGKRHHTRIELGSPSLRFPPLGGGSGPSPSPAWWAPLLSTVPRILPPFPAPAPTPLRAWSRFEEKLSSFGFLGRPDLPPPPHGAGALGSRGGSVSVLVSRAIKARGLGRRVDSLAWCGYGGRLCFWSLGWMKGRKGPRVVCRGVLRRGAPIESAANSSGGCWSAMQGGCWWRKRSGACCMENTV